MECSLEILDDEGHFKGKADMFSKRTIKKAQPVTSVDTASEALAVSLSEKAKVDLAYMSGLSGKTEEQITEELAGVIFRDPVTKQWETVDEYLSGNVREKLEFAKTVAEESPECKEQFLETFLQASPYDADTGRYKIRSCAPDRIKREKSPDISVISYR